MSTSLGVSGPASTAASAGTGRFPLPDRGDRRARDAVRLDRPVALRSRDRPPVATFRRSFGRSGLRSGTAASTAPISLVLPATRRTRLLLHETSDALVGAFPWTAVAHSFELLAAGVDPGGGSVVVV